MTKSESDQITLLTSKVGHLTGVVETALPEITSRLDLLRDDIRETMTDHISSRHPSGMTPATRAKLVAAVTGLLTAATAALYFLIS